MHQRLAQWMDQAVIHLATRTLQDGHSDHAEHDQQQAHWRAYPRDLGTWETLFALPNPPPDIEAALRPSQRLGPATHRSFAIPSPVMTQWPVNNTCRGNLFVGNDTGSSSRPTVLLLHGWNAGPAYYVNYCRTGHRLARRGVNCCLLQLPYHVDRKPNRFKEYFLTGHIAETSRAIQQAVIEARLVLRWLRQRHTGPVGIWGISLGGWIASLLACVEPELDFAVLMTPAVRLDRQIWELPFLQAMKDSLVEQGATREEILRIATPILPKFHQPVLPRERILIIEAAYDQFLKADTIEELWDAWGQPPIRRYPHGHISILMDNRVLAHATTFIQSVTLRVPATALAT